MEERETKRVRINVFDGEESDEWVETDDEWVRIHRRPRRDLFSPHDSLDGPKLSDFSRRRESIVCSTDGGEWRIVDRWDEKGSENHEPPQDLPQEWTGSTRFRKSWGCCVTVKARIKSTARPVAATSNKCSHQHETTYRWMRTVASLTFDPSHSKGKCGTLVIEKISAKYCG